MSGLEHQNIKENSVKLVPFRSTFEKRIKIKTRRTEAVS